MPKKKDKNTNHFNAVVGTSVKEAREKAGWSQEELGDFIGVSRAMVSLVESGKCGLSLQQAEKIKSVLEVTF